MPSARLTAPAHRARGETRRALAYLRDLIEDADLRQRQLEDRLGFSRGYVSQLLNGHIELKLRHLAVLLEALDLTPAQYFGALFPRQRRRVRRPGVPDARAGLKLNDDVMGIYALGIDEARDLRRRLRRCEEALEKLARSGAVDTG